MSGPPTLDTPVIIIGKTMLMHERVHRRAADLPEDFRKAVQKGGVSTSSVKILENRRSFKVSSQASVLTDTRLCTNPPFSKLKQIFAELKAIGKPFVLLCPCTTLTTKYFSTHFADDIQIIVPPRRIHFEKLVGGKPVENYKSRCNFDCFYYCWKMNLPKDLVWLTAYSASTGNQ